jgi:hypothetical protein
MYVSMYVYVWLPIDDAASQLMSSCSTLLTHVVALLSSSSLTNVSVDTSRTIQRRAMVEYL